MDGTPKRSGNVDAGEVVGEWITYGQSAAPDKGTDRGGIAAE